MQTHSAPQIGKNNLQETGHKNSRTRQFIWTTKTPSLKSLRAKGFHLLRYPQFKKTINTLRQEGAQRSSLKNPAEKILSIFRRKEKIALLQVEDPQFEDLLLLYGYLLEPAYRWGCTLMIASNRSLKELGTLTLLAEEKGLDRNLGWSLERFDFLQKAGSSPCELKVPQNVTFWRRTLAKLSRLPDKTVEQESEDLKPRLDPEQARAVLAGDGVVQVIAPAGSGKTTVLIERVRELQRRGTHPSRIICLSFNRDAVHEVGERLARAEVEPVALRSFHSLGLAILKAAGRLRGRVGSLTDKALEKLILQAETSLPVAQARNLISEFKLSAMISPAQALSQAASQDLPALRDAKLYQLYQEELVRRDLLDFDDLIAASVFLMQTDAQVRKSWQSQFEQVLVDEYQDIEPAQALLVSILAAPQDALFCVGDEDQCIYAWRRATVRRIIELDLVYPGLERHALIRNYRCGRQITAASRRLIQHNQLRFRKPLLPGAHHRGTIVVVSQPTRSSASDLVAYLISDASAKETVVLARTSRLLEEVLNACKRGSGPRPEVELATIHAAKGRQWKRVIIYGADEGQIPHAQSKTKEEIEAERRLFYVALTRAVQHLEIVCTQGRESRFLREAGLKVCSYREPRPAPGQTGSFTND